jgi:hypothetical protein
MSISGEFDKVINFGDHHLRSVIDALEIPEDDTAALQAVKFRFKVMADECRNPNISQTENNRWAIDLTLDQISKQYDNYRLYKDYFFPKGYNVDLDALVTAVICDEYIIHANEPVQDPEDPEEIIMRDDGFDTDILSRAFVIWDGARRNDLDDEETGSFSYEISFLIHLYILERLEEMGEDFADLDRDEMSKIRDEELPQFRNLILTWNLFGQGVAEYMDRLQTQIDRILTPRPPQSLAPTTP